MEYIDRSDELAHYGIMGMKWGVRNAETKARYKRDGISRRQARKDYKTDMKAAKKEYRSADKTGFRNRLHAYGTYKNAQSRAKYKRDVLSKGISRKEYSLQGYRADSKRQQKYLARGIASGKFKNRAEGKPKAEAYDRRVKLATAITTAIVWEAAMASPAVTIAAAKGARIISDPGIRKLAASKLTSTVRFATSKYTTDTIKVMLKNSMRGVKYL